MPRLRRVLPLVVLIAVAAVATGCASTSAAPAPTATPTPSQTPTPTETAPASVSTPTLPLDGECADMLTSAQLDDLLGEGWATEEEKFAEWGTVRSGAALDAFATIGGLECRWFADDDAPRGIQSLTLSVAPVDSIPAAFTTDYSAARCDPSYDASLCRLVRVDGDAWLMARVGEFVSEPPVELLESALDAVSSGLPEPLGAEAVTPDGWWPISSCEDLGEKMRLEDLIGEEYNTGFWEGSEQPEMAALRLAGAAIECEWSTGDGRLAPDGEFYVPGLHVANGSHWQWSDIVALDGSEQISVAGAEGAVLFSKEAGASADLLFATDGVNVIGVNGGGREFLTSFAERALAAWG